MIPLGKDVQQKLDRLLALQEAQTTALLTLARTTVRELEKRELLTKHDAAWHDSELDSAEMLIGKR